MKARDLETEKAKVLEIIQTLDVDTLHEIVRLYVNPTGKQETVEEYNSALNEAEERVKRGQFVTLEEFKKEMAKWK